jgi:hypothetical protein
MPGGLGAAGSSDQPLVSALLPPKRSVGPGCGCGAVDRRVLSTLFNSQGVILIGMRAAGAPAPNTFWTVES